MTNQPSPVLTAEERQVVEYAADFLQVRSAPNTAKVLRNLLSRTADPDTVTLPREVVETWIKMMADCAMHGMPITPSIAKARNVTVKALAIPQAQGGDDE